MSKLVPVEQFYAEFAACEDDIKGLLPKTLRLDSFTAATRVYLARNPKLLECDRLSLIDALMKCANDGLKPDGRQAAIVPFRDGNSKTLVAQYMPMVQGLLKRGRELGEATAIEAEAVYDADFFEVVRGDTESIVHKPYLDGPRGFVRAAFAIFRSPRGQVLHREVMLKADIDKVRLLSRAKDGSAWRDWYEEMARKSVIRRGIKYVPMGDEMRRIVERDDEFTLLEGRAMELGPSRARLGEITMDDIDEDGKLRGQAPARATQKEPAIASDAATGHEIAEAEVVALSDTPFRDDAAPDAPPDPVAALAEDLKDCESEADMTDVYARYKARIATAAEKERANLVWRATKQRIAKALAAPAAPAQAHTQAARTTGNPTRTARPARRAGARP